MVSRKTYIIGALAGALLLPLTGCSPSPDKVCERLWSLARSGDDFSRAACLAQEQALRRRKGSSWYGDRGKCVMRASSYAAAQSCRGHRRRRGTRTYSTTVGVGTGDRVRKKTSSSRRKTSSSRKKKRSR